MTYRERRERRAARLREWAEKRQAKAQSASGQADALSSAIPFGQPILVGHHSEKRHRRDLDRIDRNISTYVEHSNKAQDMASRAGNIEAQLDRSIYSDDPDAIEALQTRIAELEAERDRIKAYNASCRKGTPDESLLDERQQAKLAVVRRVAVYSLGKNGAYPAYALSNLNGNINRNRKRLEQLSREAGA